MIKVSALILIVERREVFRLLLSAAASDLVWNLEPILVSKRLVRTASLDFDLDRFFIIATSCRNFAKVD